jgi:dihydrofolate reductase
MRLASLRRRAHGGAAFVQALSRLGLIDDYRLVILPVALGSGLPLSKDLAKPLRVDLAKAKNLLTGRLSSSTSRSEPPIPDLRSE